MSIHNSTKHFGAFRLLAQISLLLAWCAIAITTVAVPPTRAQQTPAAQYTTLDVPGAVNYTQAVGIYAKGQIVGAFDGNTGGHGFLLSKGVYTTLDVPGVLNGSTTPTGINNRGQIVGYFQDNTGVVHGFLLSKGVYTTLDVPVTLGFAPNANAINNRGQIVGSYYGNDGVLHGFLLSR